MQHCLEKNPTQRFHSAGDLAFDLESLTEVSTTSKSGGLPAVVEPAETRSHGRVFAIAGAIALGAALLGLGWWLGRGSGAVPPAVYQQITFRTGYMGNARFTPDGSIVYNATWEDGENHLYSSRTDANGSRDLDLKDAELLSISKTGELAIRLNTVLFSGYERAGTLARVPLSGGAPREMLNNVQDADWAANGETMAVVRFVPENSHWRLEYPVGTVLYDGINWISNPRISADGKWVAFADHENTGGDDLGSVAVIGPDGQEKKLSSGWGSLQGVVWSPAGDEVWFTATRSGSGEDLHGVTLSGKLRAITNVPGGMWLQDVRNGVALMITHQIRIGIRGMAPGGKEERELGWFGWAGLRDISKDGKKVLFEEEGDGGGPNYTVFLRDTDGSPPVRIGEGIGHAISPDGKWVITEPAKGGALTLVPTGAGEARQLTHDNISYAAVRFLPDGRHVLASGIEAGHGKRNYLIDLSDGKPVPNTPEGTSGIEVSPNGRSTAVLGPDGKWSVWLLDGSGAQPIPGLDSKYQVMGWSPDGSSVYTLSTLRRNNTANANRVDVTTGKTELWKTFGGEMKVGVTGIGKPRLSSDGSAYAYTYFQALSVGYVVRGLK